MVEEVKVLGYWSIPFSRRVDLALMLKGVTFDYIEENIPKKSDMLLEYNPIYQGVPILVHKGKPIVGSLIILEYIEETWDGYHLLPKDPYERAHARFLANFIDEKVLSIKLYCITKATCVFLHFEDYFGMEATHKVHWNNPMRTWAFLKKSFKARNFLEGIKLGWCTLLQITLLFGLKCCKRWAEKNLFNERSFPKLWTWSQQFLASDAVKKSLPSTEKLLAYFQARKKAMLICCNFK